MMPHRRGEYRGGMRTERCHELSPGLAAEIRALVESAGGRDGAEALGEAKRAQLESGAADGGRHWSGVLAYDEGEGALVGYAHLRWDRAVPDGVEATAEVVVGPGVADRAAVARAVLDEARDLVAEAGGGRLSVWSHGVRDVLRTLPAAAGFEVDRVLAVMERPLADAPDVDPPPEGVSLRPYRAGKDDEELLRVNNEAFASHPEQGGWDRSTLEARRHWSWFDPEGLILAWRGERLLGFHWTKVHPGEPAIGEVYVLGVAPEGQGLGLGRVLLQAGLAHLRQRGCREVILYVDTANAGAVALYEAAGFDTRHLEVCYASGVAPSA